MNHSIKKGVSFGAVSGVITTLGLMVGLNSSTNSTKVIIGGILVIAIADSLSDAMGIHISEESEYIHSKKEIWMSTFCTFISKFIVTFLFIIPFMILENKMAILVNIVFGLTLITYFSLYISSKQKAKAIPIIAEHLGIAIFVIIATNYIGFLVNKYL